MPYADPEKKRQYQKSYNRQYYRRNKTRKNLVNKAVSSKQSLRSRKREYIWEHFEHKCSQCGLTNADELLVVPRDPSRRAVWTSQTKTENTPRYILDYSWDTLNDSLANLDLLCSVCRSPEKVSDLSDVEQRIKQMEEKSLPRGYVLDEDLDRNP